MPNTFDAVPQSRKERSSAFFEVENPSERLERFMDEAQLHRGSLREQDGYTIPFREGGQVRISVKEEERTGLHFVVDAPTQERLDYIEQEVAETAHTQLGAQADLEWGRSEG